MIRKFLLSVALAFALSPSAFAGLDGSATSTGTNTATATVTLTTSLTNDVVVVAITTALHFGNAATVSSVSDVAGLTWAKRYGSGSITSGGGDGVNQEIWYAFSASPLVADVVTLNLSAGGFTSSYVTSAFGVNGVTNASTAPWDTNISLPASDLETSILGPVSVTGVSTTQSNDFIVSVYSTRNFFLTPGYSFYPTGFTAIANQIVEGSQIASLTTACKGVAGTISGATYTSQSASDSTNHAQIFTVDALKGAGSGCGSFVIIAPGGGLLLRNVGQ